MAKHTQRNIIFVIFGVVIIGSMAFLFQQGASGEFEIRLPPPAQLTDAGFEPIEAPFGSAVPTGINCKVKQTTIVVGQRGNTIGEIDRIESGGLQGSPFALSFTFSLQDEKVSHFQVEPKIFCSESGGLAVEAWVKNMQVRTRGSYLGTTQTIDIERITQSSLLNFGQGQGEQRITQFILTADDLEDGLPVQNFPATYQFDVTGTLNIAYRDFPSIVYQIPILVGDLRTSYIVNILKDPFDFTCPDGTLVQDASDCTIVNPPEPPKDSDGDGILDINDKCPFSPEDFDGFEDGDGCPESGTGIIDVPEEPITLTCEADDDAKLCKLECEQGGGVWTIVNNSKPFCVSGGDIMDEDDPVTTSSEELFLSGQLKNKVTVFYDDNSRDEVVGDFTTANFISQTGTIVPTLELSGSTTGLQEKVVDRIDYQLFYIFPSSPNITLTDSDVRFTVRVIVSSVQESTGSFIPAIGAELGTPRTFTNIGTGFNLGTASISSATIENIARDAGVTEGQARKINIEIIAGGEFELQAGSDIQRFAPQGTSITLQQFTFNNEVVPVGGGNGVTCPSNTVPVLDSQGEVIDCDPIEVDTPICRTPERPQGFACSDSYIAQFCVNGDINNCVERDGDGDGFVDILDNCPNTFSTSNEGCPAGQTTDDDEECDSIRDGICVLGEIIIISNPEPLCSVLNPEFCNEQSPFTLLSTTNLLIFGGIFLVLIGVIVFIVRRRQ